MTIGNVVVTAALPDPCFKISTLSVYFKRYYKMSISLCVSLHVHASSVKNYNIFQRVVVRIASYRLCSCTHAVKHIAAQQYYIWLFNAKVHLHQVFVFSFPNNCWGTLAAVLNRSYSQKPLALTWTRLCTEFNDRKTKIILSFRKQTI